MTERKNWNKNEDFIRLQDVWNLFVSKRYVFVYSILLCVLIALLYIAKTPPVFTRTTSVLIKDDSKSGSSNSYSSISFSDIGVFGTKVNVKNEMLTLKSPALMREVVLRLKLNENYSLKGVFYDKILYDITPIKIVFTDSIESSRAFAVDLLPENKVLIYDFESSGEYIDFSAVTGRLSEPVQTPFGKIVIVPTDFYQKDSPQTILYSVTQVELVAGDYSNALGIALGDEDATILDLTIADISPKRAEDILNTLITVYNEDWIKDKNKIAVSTSKFIDERLEKIENELDAVEQDISDYKSKNLLPNIEIASTLFMEEASKNKAQILALNNQKSVAKYILDYIKNSKKEEQLLPVNTGIQNMYIESQISSYNSLLLQRNNLFQNSSEKNPLVKDMNESLVSLRESIIRSVESLIVSLDTNMENIKRSETEINERIASNPGQAKYLLSVERQQKVKESLYLYLLQKREENELSKAFTAYNTRIINPPSGTNFPSAPQKKRIILIAFALGLILPMVVLILIESLNTTVKGKKDLEALSIPFIGEIPLTEEGEKKSKWTNMFRKKNFSNKASMVVEQNNHNRINEAFRIVRTNMDFMYSQSNDKVVMFTSYNSGSGKTFVLLNLAMAFALKEKKVLVIDLDMRKGTLSTSVNSPKMGISNYLAGQVENIKDIIVKKHLNDNLDVIPLGTIPPNPSELLSSKVLSDLLVKLREKYDYIYLDCTPTEVVADASIVANVADITIFIIRAGLMDKRLLLDLETLFFSYKYKNMTVILNGTFHSRNRYSKYNQYDYQYKYGD